MCVCVCVCARVLAKIKIFIVFSVVAILFLKNYIRPLQRGLLCGRRQTGLHRSGPSRLCFLALRRSMGWSAVEQEVVPVGGLGQHESPPRGLGMAGPRPEACPAGSSLVAGYGD